MREADLCIPYLDLAWMLENSLVVSEIGGQTRWQCQRVDLYLAVDPCAQR